ncbi:MAG: hypothetical protein GY719_12985 [bacterium]|nr:hypothetical protein [bacterium]
MNGRRWVSGRFSGDPTAVDPCSGVFPETERLPFPVQATRPRSDGPPFRSRGAVETSPLRELPDDPAIQHFDLPPNRARLDRPPVAALVASALAVMSCSPALPRSPLAPRPREQTSPADHRRRNDAQRRGDVGVLDRRHHVESSVSEVTMRRRAGRNEPCPCGSGKKYKKCCLRRGGAAVSPAAGFPEASYPAAATDPGEGEDGSLAGEAIREVVDRQIRGNDPPETRETFERLVGEGHTEEEARELIALVVAAEIFAIMKTEREFDRSGFVAALRRLPALPEGLEE